VTFFEHVLGDRGAPAAVGKAYAAANNGQAISWAHAFRKYLKGTVEPRSGSIWRFAAAVRKGTPHVWCAGPVALSACAQLTDLIAVFSLWRTKTSEDLSRFISVLPYVLISLPSDAYPDLISIYALRGRSLKSPLVSEAIRAYIDDGDIESLEGAKKDYGQRQRARAVWTLDDRCAMQLDSAWAAVESGARLPWDDDELAKALAIAESGSIKFTQKRRLIFGILLNWARAAR